ncbi:type 1 fimbrial protein [Haemophilus influenzae biotype aegyptius]|nr:type 1 fimbrial protein [Haemophilus influenzae biotype aegyptius]QEQ60823.1 type 1 fimbrial protein [Haemophilus influenzae biotype aegyptius]
MEQFIMKKTLLGSLILLAFAGNVQADVNAETSGKVTFFGKVVENTCQVSTGNRDMSVVLNDVGKNSLSTKGKTAMPTPFTIKLQNCNANGATSSTNKANKVGIYFYSWNNTDKDNDFTLKNEKMTNDYATKVNIQIMEANGTDKIEVVGKSVDDFTHKNNGSTNSNAVTKDHISGKTTLADTTSEYDLHFIAQYYATDAATAGKVQSSVNFQIAYE